MDRVSLIYGPDLASYSWSKDHPLRQERVGLAVDLMKKKGLLENVSLVEPRVASDEELALIHDVEYIEMIKALSSKSHRIKKKDYLKFGVGTGDNPIFANMHNACALTVGASLQAAEMVHSGEVLHAFNPSGGLHHAYKNYASGFCLYNDVAIAAAYLRAKGHRVAIVDVDVHAGDGTYEIFAYDPNVLTISLHEDGHFLYPGKCFALDTGIGLGAGSALNLGFLPLTHDEAFIHGFLSVVPPLLRAFKPTVILTQNGVDSHYLDPLADLGCTNRIWNVIAPSFHSLAHELCEGRLVMLGGGGYAWEEVPPKAWSILLAHTIEESEKIIDLVDKARPPPPLAVEENIWAHLDHQLKLLSQNFDLSKGTDSSSQNELSQ